jgi:hypothetical protein
MTRTTYSDDYYDVPGAAEWPRRLKTETLDGYGSVKVTSGTTIRRPSQRVR